MPIIIGIMPMPAHHFGVAEGEARVPGGIAQAHTRDQQAEEQRDQSLKRTVRRDEHRARQAEQHQPEVFERAETQRDIRERGCSNDQHHGAEQSADRGEHESRTECELGPTFLGHRKRFVGVGGRRRRTGNAQQRAGYVAGKDRHRGRGDDRGDRRNRRHEERHRHQQRGRHRRGQSRHRADEQSEQRRQHHHQDGVRLEHHRESLREVGPHRATRRS